jgi:hypothetical protein
MRRLRLLFALTIVATAVAVRHAPSASASRFSINFTTFIPGNNFKAPPHEYCRTSSGEKKRLYVRTDDRGFDPNASTFRTRQLAEVETSLMDPNGEISKSNATRPTRVYADDAMADGRIDDRDDDGVDHDCRLFEYASKASEKDMHIDISRLEASTERVKVYLHGSAGQTAFVPSADISWHLTLVIDTRGSRPSCSLSGTHDGFPAYELYVNGKRIYTYWPGNPPYTVGDLKQLAPPEEEEVPDNYDCTGRLNR